jgi:hypothetical protein
MVNRATSAVVLCIVVGTLSVNRLRAAESLPDFETVRAAVDDYAGRVRTLEGKFTMTLTRDPRVGDPVGVERSKNDLRAEGSFQVDIMHGKVYLDKREAYWVPGLNGEQLRFEAHEASTFDGTRPYRLMYSRVKSPVDTGLPADVPLELIVGKDDPIANQPLPWDFAGLRLLGGGTLSTALRESRISVNGEEEINGIRCIHLVDPQGPTKVFEIWLDPEHDYLPVRMYIAAAGFFEVSEFSKFRDESVGAECWFPARGRLTNTRGEIRDLDVKELKINSPIDAARFSIEEASLPDGVKVTRGVAGAVSFTGERDDLWEQNKRHHDEEERRISALLPRVVIPAGNGDVPSSVPRGRRSGWWIDTFNKSNLMLVAAVVALLTVACFLAVRKRRN